MFRNNSAGKFNHQELNESIESQVDLDILTPEEQDSLDLNKDLTEIADESNGLPDPRWEFKFFLKNIFADEIAQF